MKAYMHNFGIQFTSLGQTLVPSTQNKFESILSKQGATHIASLKIPFTNYHLQNHWSYKTLLIFFIFLELCLCWQTILNSLELELLIIMLRQQVTLGQLLFSTL